MNLVDGAAHLWRGGLNLGSRRLPADVPADLPPVATPDAAMVVAGGMVTIDVLGNDADPEGGTLAVTAAAADRGDVSITPESLLLYTAPVGASGDVTISYTVADPTGNTSEGTATVEVVLLSVAEGEVEGEFVVGSAPGELTVTILEPAAYAGAYVIDPDDLDAGPVNLVPPRISGTAEAGATLTALPGLWAFNGNDAPLAVSRQWFRGTTAIAGETGTSHVVDAADAGQTLGIVETASAGAGTREAASDGVNVPAAGPSWSPALLPGLALWLDASDAGTVTLSGDGVIRLTDKSGHGRDAAQVAGSPVPTLGVEIGGRPALRFPTNGVLRSGGAALPGLPGMPGVTVIAVTQAHVSESFNECACIRNSAIAGGQNISVQTGYSVMWFGNGNRYWNIPPSGPVVAVAHYPANGTHGQTEWWRNGTRLSPTGTAKSGNSVSLPADTYVQLGNQDGPSSEQAECLVVIGPLSDADRQKAEGYLAHKWGLGAQLPDTHPHKAGPPAG